MQKRSMIFVVTLWSDISNTQVRNDFLNSFIIFGNL